ncbi:MAG: ornithine carbamoyltransferase [Candidatus Dormibacteraceae bacterium]
MSSATAMPTAQHVISLREFDGAQLRDLVRLAEECRLHPDRYQDALHRKGLVLLMEKTSTRTVLSFEAAINELGGYAVRLNWQDSNFSISPIHHEAAYVSRNCSAILARLKHNADLLELARGSLVPVINGCDDRYHPTQALADLITIKQVAGTFDDAQVTFVGIHNNVTNSLLVACTRVGVRVGLVTPERNQASWDEDLVAEARATGLVREYGSVEEAAPESTFLYTDTWIDMEHYHEPAYMTEAERRVELMTPYQLNERTLAGANPWIMHDMPIHPGFEIAEELVESPRSVIYQQAQNRLLSAKALLLTLVR